MSPDYVYMYMYILYSIIYIYIYVCVFSMSIYIYTYIIDLPQLLPSTTHPISAGFSSTNASVRKSRTVCRFSTVARPNAVLGATGHVPEGQNGASLQFFVSLMVILVITAPL